MEDQQITEEERKDQRLSTMVMNQRQRERDKLTHIGQMNTGWMNIWKVRSKIIWGVIGSICLVVVISALLYIFIKFALTF